MLHTLYTVQGSLRGWLRFWIEQEHTDENKLLERLQKSDNKHRDSEIAHAKKELTRAGKRLKELDNLFAKMYEDKVNETVSERNFTMLSEKYKHEQIKLEEHLQRFGESCKAPNRTSRALSTG